MVVLTCARTLRYFSYPLLTLLAVWVGYRDLGWLAWAVLGLGLLVLVLTLLRDGAWSAGRNRALSALLLGAGVLALGAVAAFAGVLPVEPFHRLGSLVVDGHPRMTLPLMLLVLFLQCCLRRKASLYAMISARYTLDVMPGRQMAVDGDMMSGLLDATEGRRRRQEVEADSDLFEFCDAKMLRVSQLTHLCTGALLIGFLVSSFRQDQIGSLSERLTMWSVPALGFAMLMTALGFLVSTTVGLMIAHRYDSLNLGDDMAVELPAQGEVVKTMLGGVVEIVSLAGLGLPPGASFGAHLLLRNKQNRKLGLEDRWSTPEQAMTSHPPAAPVLAQRPPDPITVDLSHDLLPLVDPRRGMPLVEAAKPLRAQLHQEMGFLVPAIRFRSDKQLPHGTYQIFVDGEVVARGEVEMGRLLALGPELSLAQLGGRDVVEPAFGMIGRWILPRRRQQAESMGFLLFDPVSVIQTHLAETLRGKAALLFERTELDGALEMVRPTFPHLVPDARPILSILHQTLRALLEERVWLVPLPSILQAFRRGLKQTTDVRELAEGIRVALGSPGFQLPRDAEGETNAITIDLLDHYGGDRWPEAMLDALEESLDILQSARLPAVVVTQAENRVELRQLTSRRFPNLFVLSHEEISGDGTLNLLGEVAATRFATGIHSF